MVIVKKAEFDAEVCVLKGEGTTIRVGYEPMLHILHVKQAGAVTSIELIDAPCIVFSF